jgi:hypothetical protein
MVDFSVSNPIILHDANCSRVNSDVSSSCAGNIILTPTVFSLFLIYLSGFCVVAIYMATKVQVFTFGIWMVRSRTSSCSVSNTLLFWGPKALSFLPWERCSVTSRHHCVAFDCVLLNQSDAYC